MDIYYEQYVINHEKGRNKKKKIFFNVLFVLFILISIFFAIVAFFSEELIQLVLPGIMFVLSVVSVIFLYRFKNRLDVDFDYVLKDEKLIIIKVFNKKLRKKFIEVDVKNFSALGKMSGDNAARYLNTPGVKKLYANLSEDEDIVYYAFYSAEANKNILIFEPDEQMLINFRKIIGRDIADKERPNVVHNPMGN